MSTTSTTSTTVPTDASVGSESTKTRRSRVELRKIVLDAGQDLLLTEGLGSGAEHLSFKRVLSYVEATQGIRITNASLIGRVWENQEEFQVDVVRSIVEKQGNLEVEEAGGALDEVLLRLDTSTLEMRRASLAELIRVTCSQYLESASGSAATIQIALITYISAATGAGENNKLVDSFRITNQRLTDRYMDLYDAGLQFVGWQIHPAYSLRKVAATFSAIAEGMLLRQIAEPEELRPIERLCPLVGTLVEWSMLAVAMDALVDIFGEPDPLWSA